MKEDQNALARANGMDQVLESANALTVQRKQLEDNMIKMLGKELTGDIMPMAGSAIKGLQKGKVEAWNKLVDRLPEEKRQQIVVSSLNDIFRGTGKNAQALNVTQFSKFMDDLDRSPTAKRSFI